MFIPTAYARRCARVVPLFLVLSACGSESPVGPEAEPEAAPASIEISLTDITFAFVEGEDGPAATEVAITNAGEAPLSALSVRAEYEEATSDWLDLELSGTSAPSVVRVRPMAERLVAGEHRARILVRSDGVPNSPREIAVVARVDPAPEPAAIVLSTRTVELEMQEAGANPDTVRVEIDNGGDLPTGELLVDILYDSSEEPVFSEWLISGLTSAEAPATLKLVVFGSDLDPGTWGADVVVSADGATADTLRIELTVQPGPAELRLERSTYDFATARGAPNPPVVEIDILNDAPTTLVGLSAAARYPEGSPDGWLAPYVYDNERGRWLSLGIHASSLPEGSWTAIVEVDADNAVNGPVELEVTVEVGPPTGFLQLSTGNVYVETEYGAGNPEPLVFDVMNLGVGTLENVAVGVAPRAGSEGDWISAELASTTAPTTLTLSFDVDGLNARVYYADLTLAADGASNSPVELRITLVVTGGEADLTVLGEPLDSAIVAAGESVQLAQLTFTNIGSARSNEVSVGFYLSLDAEITPDDLYLTGAGYSPIDPGELVVQPHMGSFQIPPGTAPGRYWLGAHIDDEEATPESDETNNAYARLVIVTDG